MKTLPCARARTHLLLESSRRALVRGRRWWAHQRPHERLVLRYLRIATHALYACNKQKSDRCHNSECCSVLDAATSSASAIQDR
eukprot:1467665-Pleurochrysis_carterae.AAC.2